MRYFILVLALAVPTFGQPAVLVGVDTTTVDGKAVYVAAIAARTAANIAGAVVTAARVDSQLTADDLDFSAVGAVDVLPDSTDGEWVQLDLPLASATGLAKVIVQDAIELAIRKHWAKDAGTVGRIRMNGSNATEFLRAFDAKLNP